MICNNSSGSYINSNSKCKETSPLMVKYRIYTLLFVYDILYRNSINQINTKTY